MKAVALFKPDTVGLRDVRPVERLQYQAQFILAEHVRARFRGQGSSEALERYGRLLLLLPEIRKLSAEAVEGLFFREVIGNIPIMRLLGDMYFMDKAGGSITISASATATTPSVRECSADLTEATSASQSS